MARTTRKQNAPMLRDSVEQIWLAGLGALAITEDEGSKLFKTLVKRGEGFERTTKARLDEVVASARQVPSTAMNRIEETFDDTMTGVMHRIGVPTKREINGTRGAHRAPVGAAAAPGEDEVGHDASEDLHAGVVS